ncbi:MAG: serine/threonine-protein kinase [Myxococcota bacterium]
MTAQSDALLPTEAGERSLAGGSAREVRRGETIGRYVVLSRLGAGGMGVVYAAYDPDLDRKVALKLLHRHQRGIESPASQRLLREAQAMAKLDHPNVITVHDVGTFDGTIFVAMEFVDGVTLRAWLQRTSSAAVVLDALLQAGRGLAAAHARGLVHRDFKPDNVMVADDGRVRVMDFGLVRSTEDADDPAPLASQEGPTGASLEPEADLDPAHGADDAMARVRARMAEAGKLRDVGTEDTLDPNGELPSDRPSDLPGDLELGNSGADALAVASTESPTSPLSGRSRVGSDLTRTGALLGTPAYMSPEQIHGEPVDARSDQFSFAITAWEALLGERPFQGHSVIGTTEAIVAGSLRPAPNVSGVPRFVVPALTRALSTDRDARFDSMETLVAVLGEDPSARRGMLLRVGGVLVLGGGLGGLAWANADEAPCQGAAQRLAQAWNPTKRQAARQALADTGLRHADVTANKVQAALDTYSAQWRDAHVEACEATRVRGEQSEAVMDLRMACLDTRVAELGALVAILSDADAEVASRAVQAAAHLPAIAPCADRAALTETMDPPRDDAMRTDIARIRRDLAGASALEKTGRYREATQAADEALTAAEALDYGPLTAEANLVQGRALASLDETDRAIEQLKRAALGGRASGHLEVAARAEALLTYVVGYSAGRPNEGLSWSLHAAAEIARLGGDRPVKAELLNHRAVLLQLSGDSEAALAEFNACIKERERLLGPRHPDTAESRYNLALLHRQMGAYDLARAEHEQALAIRREVYGPEHPKVADSLMALGSVAAREGETEGARKLFNDALQLHVAAFGEDHLAPARTHEALAALATITGDVESARAHSRASSAVYERRLSANDPRLGRAWMNFGSLELKANNLIDAKRYLRRAAEHYERIGGPEHPKLGWALATLGLAYHRADDDAEALATLTRAARLLEASAAEPLVRGSVHADLAEVLAAEHPAKAKAAAVTAHALLARAGASGRDRLKELARWHLESLGEPLPALPAAPG